jgi:hypothetical protein
VRRIAGAAEARCQPTSRIEQDARDRAREGAKTRAIARPFGAPGKDRSQRMAARGGLLNPASRSPRPNPASRGGRCHALGRRDARRGQGAF